MSGGMELSVSSTRIMFFLSPRLSIFQKDTGEHMVWHQDAKRCFVSTGDASPTAISSIHRDL